MSLLQPLGGSSPVVSGQGFEMIRIKAVIITTVFLLQIAIVYVPNTYAQVQFIREFWGTSRIFGKIGKDQFDFRVISLPFSELTE